mmetsp:Transcript_128077/g.358537  ORF Transcript_128077/g.358537 Transcript_128077/m.358537 type:complete len:215 (-) Transcript_128077:28-672(-)
MSDVLAVVAVDLVRVRQAPGERKRSHAKIRCSCWGGRRRRARGPGQGVAQRSGRAPVGPDVFWRSPHRADARRSGGHIENTSAVAAAPQANGSASWRALTRCCHWGGPPSRRSGRSSAAGRKMRPRLRAQNAPAGSSRRRAASGPQHSTGVSERDCGCGERRAQGGSRGSCGRRRITGLIEWPSMSCRPRRAQKDRAASCRACAPASLGGGWDS